MSTPKDAKEVIRIVANPATLQEAQTMIVSASEYMSKLQKEVHPPPKHVGLKITAGTTVLFGGCVWLASRLTALRWTDKQALKAAVHEVLDERDKWNEERRR